MLYNTVLSMLSILAFNASCPWTTEWIATNERILTSRKRYLSTINASYKARNTQVKKRLFLLFIYHLLVKCHLCALVLLTVHDLNLLYFLSVVSRKHFSSISRNIKCIRFSRKSLKECFTCYSVINKWL